MTFDDIPTKLNGCDVVHAELIELDGWTAYAILLIETVTGYAVGRFHGHRMEDDYHFERFSGASSFFDWTVANARAR